MSEILTAETDRGRTALEQVVSSTRVEFDPASLPGEWVRVLVRADTPVALIAIDPDRAIEYPGGDVRYAFLCESATPPNLPGAEDLLGELVENVVEDLRRAGIPWLVGRLPFGLGRKLGFSVFTHYSSFLLRPEEIEQTLGGGRPDGYPDKLVIQYDSGFQDDLLLVADVEAETEEECINALREAAWGARSNGKTRILFEHPPAGLPGSRYPIHATRHSTLVVVAMACGARVRVAGSDSDVEGDEMGQTVATDMLRVAHLPGLLKQVVEVSGADLAACPEGAVSFDTAAGQATIRLVNGACEISEEIDPAATPASFSADEVAQMVAGYRSASTLAYLDEVTVPKEAARVLDALFPRFWRFSRNEKWILRQWAKS